MKGPDTSLAGGPGRFPRTTWGLISRFAETDAGGRREALEELCRLYWRPVYRYVRVAWAKSNDDAKDLAQAFFLWLLERNAIGRYLPERGSFRVFLKVVLARFVKDQEEALRALKRGGGAKTIDIDAGEEPVRDVLADGKAAEPWAAFDRDWSVAVMRHAVDRVRERREREGRPVPVRVFEAYDLVSEAGRPGYPELAARFSIKETDVRNYLASVRKEVAVEVRAELARLTRDERELEEEWNDLFGS